jgi:hypothetical protein
MAEGHTPAYGLDTDDHGETMITKDETRGPIVVDETIA